MRERGQRRDLGHRLCVLKMELYQPKGKLNVYSDFSIHAFIHTRLVFDMTHLSFTEYSQ